MKNIKETIHNALTCSDRSPKTILEVVKRALKLLIPLVKAYLEAREKYHRSSSIKNGAEMQETRNALKVAYDNILNGLLDRQATEWKDTITARELNDLIESEYRNITNGEN